MHFIKKKLINKNRVLSGGIMEIEIANKIINMLEYNLEYAEYDKLQNGDKNIDAFCNGFKDAIKCIKEYYKID